MTEMSKESSAKLYKSKPPVKREKRSQSSMKNESNFKVNLCDPKVQGLLLALLLIILTLALWFGFTNGCLGGRRRRRRRSCC